MPTATSFAETSVSQSQNYASTIVIAAAAACLVWYLIVASFCLIGFVQLNRHYSRPAARPELLDNDCPDITIIRPIKGLEPRLYDCLASTFRQDYPRDKTCIRLCIATRDDPSYPVIQRLLQDFKDHNVQLLVESEDEALNDGTLELGPNPKIRNMSRAYRDAVSDFIWIIDCNIWVSRNTCRKLVAKLEGLDTKTKNKFVHQLPLSIDVPDGILQAEAGTLLNVNSSQEPPEPDMAPASPGYTAQPTWATGGGRLDELFLSSAHAKFYTAINTIAIAPCIVGKSTMFRRSHLNDLTEDKGIDYFSENICEDHLIGDRIWKQKVLDEKRGTRLGKHIMCFGELAIQPISNMSVHDYWNRRVRWLRVRKFTVTLATLVEPGTECFLCSLYGAFAFTTLPIFHTNLGIPHTWTAFGVICLLSISIWCYMDWLLYLKLQSGATVAVDEDTPSFVRPPKQKGRRSFGQWFTAWLGREVLAFPIWFWAFWGGTTVEWRGKHFWVGTDMKVHEIATKDSGVGNAILESSESIINKARRD